MVMISMSSAGTHNQVEIDDGILHQNVSRQHGDGPIQVDMTV